MDELDRDIIIELSGELSIEDQVMNMDDRELIYDKMEKGE